MERGGVGGALSDLVAVELTGRLGNQLFQVAAARSVQGDPRAQVSVGPRQLRVWGRPLNTVLRADSVRELGQRDLVRLRQIPRLPWGEWTSMKIRDGVADRLQFLTRYEFREANASGFDPRILDVKPPVLLRGYFQNEGYFVSVERDVLSSIAPPGMDARKIGTELSSGGLPTVAVMLRTGKDYESRRWVLPLSYYKDACAWIADHVGECRVNIFGDETTTCNEAAEMLAQYGAVTIAAQLDAVTQLQVMRMHDHIVLANSSFSWWVAWLSERWEGRRTDALIVGPDPWLKVGDDVLPARWYRIAR